MLGLRLSKADKFVIRRSKRWASKYYDPSNAPPRGRYRKWNQACACRTCRAIKAEQKKGDKKKRYMFMKREVEACDRR